MLGMHGPKSACHGHHLPVNCKPNRKLGKHVTIHAGICEALHRYTTEDLLLFLSWP